MVKDALPNRIRDELRFCHEDTSTFEGLKRAVLRIDNNYWKRSSNEDGKHRTIHAPSDISPRPLRIDQYNPTPRATPTTPPNRVTWERVRTIPPRVPIPHPEPSGSSLITRLGPDGQLTPAEHQRRMNLGLCMHCSQSGHLARGCPKQNPRPTNVFEGRAAHLEQEAEEPELAKKMDAVSSFPGGSTA